MITERSLYVVVTGQNPEVVLLFVMDPRIAQKAAVERVGVVDHFRGEGIVNAVPREGVAQGIHGLLRYQFLGSLCTSFSGRSDPCSAWTAVGERSLNHVVQKNGRR